MRSSIECCGIEVPRKRHALPVVFDQFNSGVTAPLTRASGTPIPGRPIKFNLLLRHVSPAQAARPTRGGRLGRVNAIVRD